MCPDCTSGFPVADERSTRHVPHQQELPHGHEHSPPSNDLPSRAKLPGQPAQVIHGKTTRGASPAEWQNLTISRPLERAAMANPRNRSGRQSWKRTSATEQQRAPKSRRWLLTLLVFALTGWLIYAIYPHQQGRLQFVALEVNGLRKAGRPSAAVGHDAPGRNR